MQSHPQGVGKLEAQAFLLVQRLADESLQGFKPAGLPGLRLSLFGLQGQTGADGEDFGGHSQQGAGVLGDEIPNLLQVGLALEDIHLVDDHDHLFAPIPNLLQEGALALGEGAVGGGEEEHQVGAGHETGGNHLVLAHDSVRAGGIHDAEFFEERHRRGYFVQIGVQHLPRDLLPVTQNVDLGGGRRDALLQDGLPQQGVDESALAGVEFTNYDQQEELVQLDEGLPEGSEVFFAGIEARQQRLQVAQQATLVFQQGFLRFGENVHKVCEG